MAHRSDGGSRTGIDVGGTFTDVVAWDGAVLRTGKLPTTPDPSVGALEGYLRLGSGPLSHGTTVATNAVLEGRGSQVALVVDEGFEDMVEIGRQDRPSLYDTSLTRNPPPVDRLRRFGLPGRGSAREVPSRLAEAIAASGAEAIAVSLLHSYADPSTEHAVAASLAHLGVPIVLSSEVVAEFREFERTSTTVLNAALVPLVSSYMERMAESVRGAGAPADPMVMRSSGGMMTAAEAGRLPVSILLSGPAGGVVAASALGDALGRPELISFDMGGTSTDVCRIVGGRPEVRYERPVGGIPVRVPSVAIHTVGAGGGSVAWFDDGGALRVGPRSAGASPGPVAYGKGGSEPTVTDANLVLGRLDPAGTFGEAITLDRSAAASALGTLGLTLGMSPEATARGVIEVVEAHMGRALRRVSVEEGADPRSSWLVAFGGAGGLHATALARSLDTSGVLIPPHAGVFSALGLLLAPPRVDEARSVLLQDADATPLDGAVGGVAARAAERLEAAGIGVAGVETIVDMRYSGQSHETSVPYRPGEGLPTLVARFHEAHRALNGFALEGRSVEMVTVRAEAVGSPALRWADLPSPTPSGEAQRGERTVLSVDGVARAGVWWRPGLAPGDEVVGPAVIEEPEATTYLAAGERAVVHPSGALEVEW